MKTTLLFLATATLAYSQTDTSRQLKESIEKHDAAVLAAVEPIHQRHVEELRGILLKATRSGDLDTALKAKEQLAKYGVKLNNTGEMKPAATNAVGKLSAQLNGTVWQHSKETGNVVTLHPDGTTTASWHNKRQKWKATGATTMEMSYANSGATVEFTVDAGLTMMTNADARFIRVTK